MKGHSQLNACVWCVAAVGCVSGACAAPPLSYRLTPLPGLSSSPAFSPMAMGINNQGVIVGMAPRPTAGGGFVFSPVRWDHGVIAELPGLGGAGPNNQARTIADSGIIAGISPAPGTPVMTERPVAWIGGFPVDLGSVPGHTFNLVWSINSAGSVVGMSSADPLPFVNVSAVKWTGGSIQILAGPVPFPWHEARDINDSGVATGSAVQYDEFGIFVTGGRALRWDASGALTVLPLRAGDDAAQAFAINNGGRVAGGSGTIEEVIYDPQFPPVPVFMPHAAVWQGAQTYTLGEVPGDTISIARDINDAGVVIGESGWFDPDPQVFTYAYRPAVWAHGRALDFQALIETSSPGWVVIQVHAINNRGTIIGSGYLNGEFAAFVAEPVPGL